MESIAVALQPHKDTVGQTAALVTVVQFFSGVLVVNEIRRRGSTDGFSAVPFLACTVFCLLNVQFGQMLQDDGMIRVNFIGLALHLLYVCAFYLYTPGPKKTAVWGQIGLAGAFTVGVLSYVQYEDPKVVEFRFGVILTAILWTLVGMPLLGLGDILKKKSTEGLPFPIILLGSIVSFCWLLYGIILRQWRIYIYGGPKRENEPGPYAIPPRTVKSATVLRSNFLVVQNLMALALGAVQLSLFIIFPSSVAKPPPSPAKKQN